MAFLRDAHHGKLEVLRGLRPAATLQTPTGGRIMDSHHGPEPWRRGPQCRHQLGDAGGRCVGGSVSSFLNISKSSEEESKSHALRRISKKLLCCCCFLKSINLIKKQLVYNRENQNLH